MKDYTRYTAHCPCCPFTVEFHPDNEEGATLVYEMHLKHAHDFAGSEAREAARKEFFGGCEVAEAKPDPLTDLKVRYSEHLP